MGTLVVITGFAATAHAAQPGDKPEVQRPEGLENSVSQPATATTEPLDPPDSSTPEVGDGSPPSDAAPLPGDQPDTAGSFDEDLLASEAPSTPPPPPARPRSYTSAPAIKAWSDPADAYRTSNDRGRLNIAARILFANAGGNGDVGGRLGGAQIDVGQAWNNIGYAATVSAWAGQVLLNDRQAEMTAMFGGGPTVHLGRRALVGRGLLDLRVGYDFYYGAVGRRRDAPATVGNLEQADNLAPHGPRVTLNMGLLGARKHLHGFGLSMGYQALVGSFRGELPYTHMLTLGVSYWFN